MVNIVFNGFICVVLLTHLWSGTRSVSYFSEVAMYYRRKYGGNLISNYSALEIYIAEWIWLISRRKCLINVFASVFVT